jgi:hypothetical protein
MLSLGMDAYIILLIIIAGLNYLLGHKWHKFYNYLIAIYIGTTLSEFKKFGSNIFVFYVPCFNNCKMIQT